jgi:transcriptional regulator with XRE-family HTH domain
MSVFNLQQKIPLCQLKTYNVVVYNFDAGIFGEWLESNFQKSPFKSYAALGEKIGVSRTTISAIAAARPQSMTGKPSQPKRELVIALATALNADVDQALLLAGHAPTSFNAAGSETDRQFSAALQLLSLSPADLPNYESMTEDDKRELLEMLRENAARYLRVLNSPRRNSKLDRSNNPYPDRQPAALR